MSHCVGHCTYCACAGGYMLTLCVACSVLLWEEKESPRGSTPGGSLQPGRRGEETRQEEKEKEAAVCP